MAIVRHRPLDRVAQKRSVDRRDRQLLVQAVVEVAVVQLGSSASDILLGHVPLQTGTYVVGVIHALDTTHVEGSLDSEPDRRPAGLVDVQQ